jgi:broad-specificity NMP kinase
VYGVETAFIDRVLKSWQNTTGNFGVLLNGMKGTGKTVTSELIANSLELPVIVVNFHHKKLVSFLNNIQQDTVIFIDEFEKIYDGWQNSLLTIMDGAMKTKHRLFFLLTTNELRVDKNLLQRPGRVRYVKTFSDMPLSVIMEVVEDKLEHKHLKDVTVEFISQLPIITMDLISSIIQEVNIHEEDPNNFKDIFNIHSDKTDLYNVFEMDNGKSEEVASYVTVSPNYFDAFSIGQEFRINNHYKGTVVKVLSEHELLVQEWQEDDKGNDVEKFVHYRLEKSTKTHRSFVPHPAAF